MQQSNQEIYPYQKDEIDLREVIYSFVERKFVIFGLTAFITLLAIIYALNIEPTYKAVSSFTSPSAGSIMNLNKLFSIETTESYESYELKGLKEMTVVTAQSEHLVFQKDSVFSHFLTTLASKEFQKEVFIDGDYLTSFNPNDEPIDDVNKFISQSINLIELSPPATSDKALRFNFLTELPYSVSMEGKNPVAISNYLNDLVAAADASTVKELINLIKQEIDIRLAQISIERQLLLAKERQEIDIRLAQISIERQLLLTKAKQERLYEIEILTDASIMAKSLGIIDNNFNHLTSGVVSNLIIAIGENQALPDWYLYGEKALIERVNALKSRNRDEPFIPELVGLDNEKLKLESNLIGEFLPELVGLDNEKLKLESSLIDTIVFSAKKLSQVAITPIIPIKPNKRMIVLMAFIVGFIFSIFVVLFMNVLKPNEKNST